MAKKPLSVVGMAGNDMSPAPTKGQKAFHTLIGSIEKRRADLAEWEVFDTDFRRRYNDEFVPLRTRFDAVRGQLVHRLDQSYDTRGLTKGERQTIEALIGHVAGAVLASIDDPALAEVYRRYRAPHNEADPAAVHDQPEATEATLEQLDEQDDRERKRREAREEYHARRKKAPKRDAAEDRERAEQAEVHLSLREVYRKLASLLHPDREPDPVERERKAALMQRVNMAYASRSLLELLEIQLEIEHIDRAALDNISDDRLKRWNAILKGQLLDIEQEIAEIETGYRVRCGMDSTEAVSPRTVKRALTLGIDDLREYIKGFEKDLRVLDSGKELKPWLKRMKSQLDEL